MGIEEEATKEAGIEPSVDSVDWISRLLIPCSLRAKQVLPTFFTVFESAPVNQPATSQAANEAATNLLAQHHDFALWPDSTALLDVLQVADDLRSFS